MAPPLSRRLPKVTEYVKNVGKSVGYSAVDYFKGSMSESSDFIESNQELFRDIVVATKNYKRTLAAADRAVRQSKIYEAGSELKKTLFESIRTGKFYDEERENYYRDKASGSMGDMSDMDDWGFDTDQFDIGSESFDEADSANMVASAVKDSTVAQANIIAKSSEYLAEVNKASTRLLFTQGERMYSVVNGGLANTQSLLTRINDFLMGPMTTHMENSKKFYESTTNAINEINASLKELTEMQRNLYKREQARVEESAFSRAGGTSPDLRAYAKEVKKNFMEVLGPEVQMLLGNDMGEDSNMLMALVANPLKFVPDFIVKSIVPHTIKKSLEALDESFSSLFANFIARMNKAAKGDGESSFLMEYIGRIFGLKLDTKSSVDPSKYEKGPVPFDGITRKTIVDVIPGHLARIEAALTNRTERIFDYESGKWTTADKIEKEFKDRKSRNIRDAAWDVSEEVREYISGLRRVNEEQANNMQAQYDKLIRKIYEDGYFTPYKAYGTGEDKQNPWDYFDMDKETFLRFARMMVGTAGDGSKGTYNRKANSTKLAGNILESKERWARYLRDVESKGHSTARYLYNNAYDYSPGSYSAGTGNGTGIGNIISDAKDKYNKNIFYYLRGIYAELTEIRSNGGISRGGGSGGSGGSGGGGGSTNPRDNLERLLQSELDAATPAGSSGTVSQTLGEYDLQWDERVTAEAEIDRLNHTRLGSEARGFLEELLQANSMGAKFKVIKNNLAELTKKPGLAIAGVIDQADRRIFQLLFGSKEGDEIVDEDGNKIKGFLDYIINRTRQTFDKMNDFIDDQILRPLKEKLGIETLGDLFKKIGDKTGLTNVYNKVKDKVKYYAQPTVDRLKEKLGWGWGQFKGSMGRTYGTAWNRAKSSLAQYTSQGAGAGGGAPQPVPVPVPVDSSGIPYAEEDDGQFNLFGNSSAQQYIEDDEGQLQMFARGSRRITKRGLAILSPGEKVIPVGGRNTQRNNLTSEVAFARQHGLLSPGLRFYATGTADPTKQAQDEMDAIKDTTQKVMDEVMKDDKHKGLANVIASSLIGGGASILTGMIGGPLLGAAAGAAFGITQNSKTVQDWLFGEEVTNEETGEKSRKGGVISKDLQEKFKKYFPSMRDFGLAGAVAGLFTPFGLVGGLMAGSALGFAKETDSFQDWLFGKKDKETGERDGGLIKKEFRDKVKKAAPRMLIGAAGTALLGPFGLLGNAVLGSALGFTTTTNKFHEMIFGKEDANGKKKGGILNALKYGVVLPLFQFSKYLYKDTTEFMKKHVLAPLKDFGTAMRDMIINGIENITEGVKYHLNKMFEKTIGIPLGEWFQHKILDNATKLAMKLVKIPLTAAKGVIGAPAHALGWIGNNIRMGQISKGTARGMTAAQRMQYRREHIGRNFMTNFFSKDQSVNVDNMLATEFNGETGIDDLKAFRDALSDYRKNSSSIGATAARLINECGEAIRNYLETTYLDPSETGAVITMSIYMFVGAGTVKAIKKKIATGKVNSAIDILKSTKKFKLVPDKYKTELASIIDQFLPQINQAIQDRTSNRIDNAKARAALGRLSQGYLKKNKNIRRLLRNVNYEIDAREAEEAKNRAEDNPVIDATDRLTEVVNKKSDRIYNILVRINAALGGEPPEDEDTTGSGGDTEGDETQGGGADDYSDVIDETNRGPRGRRLLDSAKNRIRTIGGTIIGAKNRVAKLIEGGYRIISTPDGRSGLVDSAGKAVGSLGKKVKDLLARDENNKLHLWNKMSEMADGVGNIVGGLFGKAGSFLKNTASGLLGIFTGGSGNTIVGKIASFGGFLFKAITFLAAFGHFSEFWSKTIWPAIETYVLPIGSKIFHGITDFIKGKFPTLYNFLFGEAKGIFTKISSFMDDPLGAITGWYKDGLTKFWHYIGEPLKSFWTDTVSPYVTDTFLPKLTIAIRDGIRSAFGVGSGSQQKSSSLTYESSETKTVQKRDENGNLLYYATDGSYTTTNTGNPVTETYTENKVEDKLSSYVANGTTSLTHKTSRDKANRKFTCFKGDAGGTTILCEDSGEYIRLPDGEDSNTICYGYICDNNMNQIRAGSSIGGIAGIVLGIVGGIKLAAAIASAAAVAIPLTICGLIVGAAAFLGWFIGKSAGGTVGAVVYELEDGNYAVEIQTDRSTDKNASVFLNMFGCPSGNAEDWPDWSRTIDNMKVSTYNIDNATSSYTLGKGTAYTGTTNATDNSKKVIDMTHYTAQESDAASYWATFTVRQSDGSETKYIICGDKAFSESDWGKYGYSGYDGLTSNPNVTVYNWKDIGFKPSELLPGVLSKKSKSDSKLMYSSDPYVLSEIEADKKSGSSRSILKKFGNMRKKLFGKGHLYQDDPRLSGIKFGNSTIGEAGCGPVAATNLINKMGSMDLGTAARMAIPYQTSDGGVSTDYFTDIFNKAGIGGTQTDSKSALANSIKNGQPTVLLGRSSAETGTPFGANDHYITAMGTDGRGNAIVEDPDLPGSSYKYPLSKVMSDTTTGIMTGQRRRRGMKRRYGFERTLGDTSSITQSVSAIAKRAYDVIHQSEGNYNSINKDDNGALSIGKIQWHAERAFDLAKKIMDATGSSQSLAILGNALYNEIATGSRSDWSKRIVSSSEADKLGKFISTDIGKAIQDMQGYLDVQNYIDSGKSYGLTDENALIYYADMYNQGPKYAIQVVKAAIQKAGSASAVTLDLIHQCALQNSVMGKYATRRTNAYNIIKNGTRVGNGTYAISSAGLSLYDGSYQYTSSSSSDVNNPWSSAFSDAGTMAASSIFGEGAVSGILAALNSRTGSVVSPGTTGTSLYNVTGSISSNGYGTTGSASQQSLVNKMASINGKLRYSLDPNEQDPDKGVASCASTVGWAYRKALGVTGMSASSTTQSQDDRFTTIWTANGKSLVDPSILQPGDVMYYNWDRTSNNGTMQHTEMYAGNNQTLSHGGNPAMGPTFKNLDTRTKNLMMVRRYNGFLSGSRRRRGYARAMTSGVNANISDNAKRIISQYGISTNSSTPAYTNIASDAGYQQFLAVMIDLLAVIADNTKGIADLQKAMSSKGIDIDTSTIEKAAANARRRAARARTAAQRASDLHMPYIGSQEDIQNMMNTPTGYMVQAMEALASE